MRALGLYRNTGLILRDLNCVLLPSRRSSVVFLAIADQEVISTTKLS